MSAPQDEWMLVGRVVGPFGVRGEAKVELLTDFPDRFQVMDVAYFGPERRPLSVKRSRRHRGMVLLTLEGIHRPEQVTALRDCEVFVPRAQAMPLPEGHYYLEDLIGMRAISADGRALGRVTGVLRTGSNDVYVINQGRDAILVPAIKDAVRALDFDAGVVVVETWVLESHD